MQEKINGFTNDLIKREVEPFNAAEFDAITYTAKRTIDSIFDKWNIKVIDEEFLRFNNLTLELVKTPLKFMTPLHCTFKEEEEILKMEFLGKSRY